MAATKIKLLLVDDHPIVREGIRARLGRLDHLEIAGEAASGREAVRKAKALVPDIVLLDISMPDLGGVVATKLLRKAAPQAKVLILSAYNNKEYVTEAVRAGARGYVLKDCSPDTLVRAITAVHRGKAFFSSGVSQAALDDYVEQASRPPKRPALSDQERRVLALIAEGATTKDIAHRLGVSVRTVETYRVRLRRKLDIHTVAELTKFAVAAGITRLP